MQFLYLSPHLYFVKYISLLLQIPAQVSALEDLEHHCSLRLAAGGFCAACLMPPSLPRTNLFTATKTTWPVLPTLPDTSSSLLTTQI